MPSVTEGGSQALEAGLESLVPRLSDNVHMLHESPSSASQYHA